MTIVGIILMILAGIVLFLLEFLVVPGVTVAGIGGLLMLGASIYLAFNFFDTTTGLIVLVVVIVILILTLILALRAKTWRKISLATGIDSHVSKVDDQRVRVGAEGMALTRLNPIGTVVFDDQKMEGRSEGHYIDQKTPVVVVKVAANHVVVKPKE